MEATRGEVPFVIHISEGVDEECRGELEALDALGALRSNTLLVHGVAFTPENVERVAEAGAKVAWCPFSNRFLYGKSVDVRALLDAGVEVSLGTDSTVSGSAHLLDELKFARRAYRESYGEEIEPRRLVAMVTTAAASALLQKDRLGALVPGAAPDLLLLEGAEGDPYERLVNAEPGDIDLLVCGARPVLGNPRHESLFLARGERVGRVVVQGREKLAAHDPAGLLREIREKVGGEKTFHFLPL
jgi:cytosine/adenosine deaminase-related metal-dependent hydrolase